MKRLIVALVLALAGIGLQAQFTNASLQASGLTCSMCSKAVKVALEKVPFVQEVKVNIKSQEYAIMFKEKSDADFDALKKAVEDAGFSVASLKVTGNFNDVNVEKDKHLRIDGKNFHFVGAGGKVLNGAQTFTIVDKDFVSARDYKKYSTATKMDCIRTGKAENCCVKEGIHTEERVYHVII
ncbi:MAG TPA: heavy-metal-associated domain-containing protein [Chitinophagaceae bacterium]|nr:heavy-metal-associated domain-containing protein [Chitinophagaceae bacterium]